MIVQRGRKREENGERERRGEGKGKGGIEMGEQGGISHDSHHHTVNNGNQLMYPPRIHPRRLR